MLKFENPDFKDAILGVSDDDRIIYDYELMVKCLMEQDGMTEIEAIEFIDYNTVRSLPYFWDQKPTIILYRMELEEIEEYAERLEEDINGSK